METTIDLQIKKDELLWSLLKKCSNDELKPLAQILAEPFSSGFDIFEIYKTKQPTEYIDIIISEIYKYGGNTIMNCIRGEGVEYNEIVFNVTDKLKIKYDDLIEKIDKIYNIRNDEQYFEEYNKIIIELEQRIVWKILFKYFSEHPEEFAKIEEDLKPILTEHNISKDVFKTGGKLSVTAFQVLFKAGGFKSYTTMMKVVNKIFRMSFETNYLLNQYMKILTGPIATAITTTYNIIAITGPAYRVTIPTVCYIGMLRALKFDS